MTREEAIKFAEYAQIMADGKPDVQEFYKLAESALRAQQELESKLRVVESNAPLTLDELRMMDDPVWCSCKPIEGGDGYWCLCKNGIITTPAGSTYDVTEIPHWVLYLHKPEKMDI